MVQAWASCLAEDDSVKALTEPSSSLLLLDAVGGTGSARPLLSLRHTESRSTHDSNHVHAENADTGVVLDAQVNVLCDAKPKVARVGEVASSQFVLLYLEASLEDLLCLGATDGDVAGNLFVTTDTKSTKRWRGEGGGSAT